MEDRRSEWRTRRPRQTRRRQRVNRTRARQEPRERRKQAIHQWREVKRHHCLVQCRIRSMNLMSFHYRFDLLKYFQVPSLIQNQWFWHRPSRLLKRSRISDHSVLRPQCRADTQPRRKFAYTFSPPKLVQDDRVVWQKCGGSRFPLRREQCKRCRRSRSNRKSRLCFHGSTWRGFQVLLQNLALGLRFWWRLFGVTRSASTSQVWRRSAVPCPKSRPDRRKRIHTNLACCVQTKAKSGNHIVVAVMSTGFLAAKWVAANKINVTWKIKWNRQKWKKVDTLKRQSINVCKLVKSLQRLNLKTLTSILKVNR